jgi:putative ABC transport system permease protein
MPSITKIAFTNLFRKRIRTVLTLLGIALSSWVLVSLLGFNRGYERSLDEDIDNLGFQLLLTAKGCPYEAATLMLQGGAGMRYLPYSMLDSLRADPDVTGLTPFLMQAVFNPYSGDHGSMVAFMGVDPETFPRMKSYLEFAHGKWFTDPHAREVVLGYEAAELEQREIGDKILIADKDVELTVVGILKRSGTQDDGSLFVPIMALQEIFGMKELVTGIGIQLDRNADSKVFEERLYELPDVQVISMAQVRATISSLVGTARIMVMSIALIAVLIAMVGVMNTILMSVFERYQEIGIMRSMGAKASHIFRLILTETFILCFTGSVIGTLLSTILTYFTDMLIRYILPFSPRGALVVIDFNLAIQSVVIIVGVGLLSGLYPSFKATRIRPIEAIRYSEGEL